MNKHEIIQILNDWNFWSPSSHEIGHIRASYLDRLLNLINSNQVITVIGPRRAGKSFILKQAIQQLISSNKLASKDTLMVNFEDPRFLKLDTYLLEKIYETYKEFLFPNKNHQLFLDEIQEVENWEKWVRYIHELQKAKLVISGSNAKLLSQELGTLLTGRHLDLVVYPLSFREFLEFKGIVLNNDLNILSKSTEIKGLLRQYLEFGSFPEVILSDQKKLILLSYFEDLINKDLLRRFKIRKIEELKSLVKFYLTNVASLTTFNSVEKFLKISASTAEKYSAYLEQVYLIFFLKRFSFKVREQEKSPRKIYSIDTGISNAIGFRSSENLGHLVENIVFIELKRQQSFDVNLEIYYWKDVKHNEVDFVLKNHTDIKSLIQVCWNLDHPKTKNREIKSLISAIGELKCSEAIVITEELETTENHQGYTINFVPLWKWLLK